MTKVFYHNCSINKYIILMILYWSLPVESLHWNITSKYIVFGKDILLNCDGTACSSKSTKMWIGGPQNDIICFNEASSNPSKYEMMIENHSPSFGLKIKNLTIDDVNFRYTCACGLQQYTRMLDLNYVKYIYPPQIDDHFNMQNADGCHVDIVMAVYPLPRCLIVYERSSVNRKMTNNVLAVNFTSVPNTYSVFNRSSIYQLVRIQHSLQKLRNNSRGGYPYLKCIFESVDKSVFYHNLTICQEDHKDNKQTNTDVVHGSIIAVTVIVLFLAVVLSCLCYCMRDRNRHQTSDTGPSCKYAILKNKACFQ